jgi:hypothetical protein
MIQHLIHTPGDLIVVMGDDGRPRAYEVEPDGGLTEKSAASAVALYSARQTTDAEGSR